MALPPLKWRASPNFSERTARVDLVVIHDAEGEYEGTVNYFATRESQVSAHFVLKDDCSEVTQMVALADKAWHVCFAGDERFISPTGSARFRDRVGTRQLVLTPDGFKEADIKSFGIQKLNRVTFAAAAEITHWRNGRKFHRAAGGSRKKSIRVTPDHIWPLIDGSLTSSLSVGDVVQAGYREPNRDSAEYRGGVRDGFVFGDGYLQSSEKSHMRFAAPMHGDKERVAAYFEDVAFWPSRASREHTYRGTGLCNSDRNLKETPPIDADPDYLAGFMEGWIIADGCDRGDGTFTLSCVDRAALEFASEVAAVAGMSVCGPIKAYVSGATSYKPGTAQFNLNIRKGALDWLVTAITPDAEEEVFCAQLPETDDKKLFILDGGVLTHNCAFNSRSVGIEMSGFSAKGFPALEWETGAEMVAYLLHHLQIPCQWARHGVGPGFTSHFDLGPAGGGHKDPTTDPAKWAYFCDLVQKAHARADFPIQWEQDAEPTKCCLSPKG